MRRSVAVTALVTVLAVGAYGAADAYDVVPGVVTLAPPAATPSAPAPAPSSGSSRVPSSGPSGTASAGPTPARSAVPTLAPLPGDAPRPVPARVRAALAPALASPALRGQVSAYVVDVATGAVLLDRDADRPRVPASSAKLLTGAALLSVAGPQERLRTRVVEGGPGEVVLVGGGDVLLGAGAGGATGVVGRAGLRDLAVQVARALRAAPAGPGASPGPAAAASGPATTATAPAAGARRVVPPVRLLVDDSLFTGAALHPQWKPVDVRFGITGPVTPLGLATDHPTVRHPGPPDPALRAGRALAAELRRQGVPVSAVAEAPAPARTSARELGSVASAPLGDVVSWALATSDNQLTDVLARLVAVRAGRAADFAGATAEVVERVRALGVDTSGVRLVDGSGLARGTAVPARVLGDLVALAAGPDDRAAPLRPVVTGLPVAGLTGTLADRYRSGAARPAAGLVRAKTGTLTGVSSLTGTVLDADGRLLAFALLADSTSSTSAARAALDRAATALAACGCR